MSTEPEPTIFLHKLQVLKEQLPLLLQEYAEAYLYVSKHPENVEYQTHFDQAKDALHQLVQQLMQLETNVQSQLAAVNQSLYKTNQVIEKEKQVNRKLKRMEKGSNDKENASQELISDYTTMYDLAYWQNWSLVLCILFFFAIVYLGVY